MIADQKTWEMLLDAIDIKLVSIGHSSFCLKSLDGKYKIGMGNDNHWYESGWFRLQDLENCICRIYPMFVYFDFESMLKQRTAVNPYLGYSSLEEMLVRKDLL